MTSNKEQRPCVSYLESEGNCVRKPTHLFEVSGLLCNVGSNVGLHLSNFSLFKSSQSQAKSRGLFFTLPLFIDCFVSFLLILFRTSKTGLFRASYDHSPQGTHPFFLFETTPPHSSLLFAATLPTLCHIVTSQITALYNLGRVK